MSSSDLLLHGENVRELPAVFLSPEVRVVPRVDELRSDGESVSPWNDPAGQHRPDAELLADGPRAHVLSLVVKGRPAGDDLDPWDLRHAVDQALGDAVAQILRVGIASRIDERQHGQRVDRFRFRSQEDEGGERRERGDGSGPQEAAPGAGARGLSRRGGRRRCGGARRFAEGEGDVARRLEALLRPLLEAVTHDPLEGRRDPRVRSREPARLLLEDRVHRFDRGVAAKGPLPRQHLVENRSEGKDVREVIRGQSAHLLGRHVANRSHDHAGLRLPRDCRGARLLLRGNGVNPLREAEVENLEVAVPIDEEVLGLQVAVDDPLLVSRGEPSSDLQRVVHGLLLRNWPLVELSAQRLALQKLHDGVGRPVVRPEIVDSQDIGMRQSRDGLGLAFEPRQPVGVGRHRLRQDLDGDVPIELAVPGPVHLAHPARAQRGEDLVRPQPGPRH